MGNNFGSNGLQSLSTYLLSRVPGYQKNYTLGPLKIKGWYDNNTRFLAIDFNISVSYTGNPVKIAQNLTHVIEKLFDMIPNNTGGLLNTTGANTTVAANGTTNGTSQFQNLLKYPFMIYFLFYFI